MVHYVEHLLAGAYPIQNASLSIFVKGSGSVEERLALYANGGGTLATIYSDEAGTIPLANPLTSEADGSVECYLEHGGPWDFYPVKDGVTFDLPEYLDRLVGGGLSLNVVDLGPGAVATLGTTGGDGPDSSVQAGWLFWGINPNNGRRMYTPFYESAP